MFDLLQFCNLLHDFYFKLALSTFMDNFYEFVNVSCMLILS